MIDGLPANRLPIKNCVVDTSYRQTAYTFMKKQIAEGRQCYIICPMVEESEAMEVENVTDYSRMLQEEMGTQIVVDHLHGKMKQAAKDEIMERFGRNEIQILVSTTVIEVGIDVPNATVMMIENAERFRTGAASSAPRSCWTRKISVLLYFYDRLKGKRNEKTSGNFK